MRWLPIVAVLLASPALAGEVPSYETRELNLTVTVDALEDLRFILADRLRERMLRLELVTDEGVTRTKPKHLPLEAVAAGLVALIHETREAEMDLVMGLSEDGDRLPMTVLWTGKKLRFDIGEPLSPRTVPSMDPDDVRARYKLGALVEAGRPWDARSLELLELALSTLSVEERAMLESIDIVRTAGPDDVQQARIDKRKEDWNLAEATASALYTRGMEDGQPRIELYDTAFEPFSHFIGTPDAPRPMSFMTLLHEMGHAIAEHARTRLHQAFVELAAHPGVRVIEAESKLLSRIKERIEDPSSGTDTRLAAQGVLAPTWYGKVSSREHFAEAFALYHGDRDALERISPETVAWFDSGAHLTDVQADLALLAEARAILAGE